MSQENIQRSPESFSNEKARYAMLKTQGLIKDIDELRQHIQNLKARAPVDSAGAITGERRNYIETLKLAYNMALAAQERTDMADLEALKYKQLPSDINKS